MCITLQNDIIVWVARVIEQAMILDVGSKYLR